MGVDFNKFLNWVESRFDNISVSGNEIKVNSIFCEDSKRHLYCNPLGGKKERPYGVYRCWKSDERGSLAKLIMLVDKCTFQDALNVLGVGDVTLAQMEEDIAKFFEEKSVNTELKEMAKTLHLPPNTRRIIELPPDDFFRTEAELYLAKRHLPVGDLMVCTSGDFVNRIVIPYYDRDGILIFYNARYLGKSDKVPKYLGATADKGSVLYFPTWPPKGSKICIVEGEFDAISICVSGLFSCAIGGKYLTEKQSTLLSGYKPILCLDNDKSGKKALPQMGDFLLQEGFEEIGYIRPPVQFKDWNEMLEKTNASTLKQYITAFEKPYDELTSIMFSS
jgi:DNA primase